VTVGGTQMLARVSTGDGDAVLSDRYVRGVVLKKKWGTPETRQTKIYSYIKY